MACTSAANDAGGNVIFTNGNTLYSLKRGDRVARKICPGFSGAVLGDSRDVFVRRDADLFKLTPIADGSYAHTRVLTYRRGYTAYAVAPAGTTEGYAAKAKFFALDAREKKVYGWTAAGEPIGPLLDLTGVGTKDHVGFEVVGCLPGSGKLVVGATYPDCRLLRFSADGKQENGGIWPFAERMTSLSLADGALWGAFPYAVRLEDMPRAGKLLKFGDGFDRYAYSVASDGCGGYYLATSQGLKHYAENAWSGCDYRLGGAGTPAALALATNGTIVAAMPDGHMYALLLDDDADAPFRSTGNEHWLVGQAWNSGIVAALPGKNGAGFLLLDPKHKTIWRFEPWRNPYHDPQYMVNLRQPLTNPTDFAWAGDRLVIADAGKLSIPVPISAPILKVDAFNRNELVVAGKDFVAFIADGKTVWKQPIAATDIAVIGDWIAVAGEQLQLLDKSGRLLTSAPYALQALAAEGKYLVGADHARAAILKFLVK
ncbi:MAG: hypothetical protein WC708_17770 [Lentisphaeria bacterium]